MQRRNHRVVLNIFERRWSKLKRSAPKLRELDLVRISKAPSKFMRSFHSQNLDEVFEVSRVITTFKVPLFEIRELMPPKTPVLGRWYQFQLCKISADTKFKKNEVVKKEKEHVTINFKGLPKDLTLRVPLSEFKRKTLFCPLKQFVTR